ncbi:aldo/keto reductase [Streptosporangium sp. NBC_01495]|uniref:aldo/keto reductase n=1 Tax=Streptosporangium sp. NBC_01495 TaxID=2903899 RepID=UPI002E32255E|nr:aldo/keto reductase [Streptosporangium sp. NBC_01495]
MRRIIGRSGIETSALGMGCWAIGGPWKGGDAQFGWGAVDDDESIRTVHRALDLGVTFFDTASNYGAGHSESVLGRALAGRRDEVVVASKWGWTFDERTREAGGSDSSAAYLRECLEGSLRRLGTDHIDLYQLHINELPVTEALDLIDTLEDLVADGRIRAYGWSTDNAEHARAFAIAGPHCTAVQHDISVLRDAADVIAVCEATGQASVNRGPLAMGLLSGKYHDGRTVGRDDVRSQGFDWQIYFREDGAAVPEWLPRIEAARELLTSGGRTLAQGALAWLWARSETTIPIPGCRTVAQVEENAGALQHGPLGRDEFAQLEEVLKDLRTTPDAKPLGEEPSLNH